MLDRLVEHPVDAGLHGLHLVGMIPRPIDRRGPRHQGLPVEVALEQEPKLEQDRQSQQDDHRCQ